MTSLPHLYNTITVILPDIERLSLAVAKRFMSATMEPVSQRGQALVALSGGSTLIRMLRKLAAAAEMIRIWI